MTAYHPFRSATAKEQYLKLHDKRAKKWPVDSETRFLNTYYGQTFIRISGPTGAPPLVLLHGGGGNSLQWIPNIEALSKSHKVYAADNIYDLGRSIYTRRIKGPDDFVKWLDELFSGLGLENNISLMGLSYGGWLTSLYALRFPERLNNRPGRDGKYKSSRVSEGTFTKRIREHTVKKRLPIFTTPEGRAKHLAAYEAMFALWRVPHNSIDVKTKYGSTHINVSGPDDGHPLVLLHGAGLSSTAWFTNVAELSAHYRVYAVDGIGDAGKSVAHRPLEKGTEYAEWLKEVFDGLNIEKGYLLGHSYGGWLALNMALVYPDRLRKVVLIAPAASIYPMGFLTNLGLRIPLKMRLPARFVFKMIASKGTVFDEIFIHLMEMVTRYCVPALMFPTVYTDDELRQIERPTLLLIGAEEKIYNPIKAIDRAQRLMPDLTAEIIPNVGHTLNMEQPETVNARILAFLSSDEC